MGDSEISNARNYEYGAAGRMALDRLPMTGAMTTYAVCEDDPSAPDYTPESASTTTRLVDRVQDGRRTHLDGGGHRRRPPDDPRAGAGRTATATAT